MSGCGRRIGPYDCCTIVTGDAKELAKAIPDESVGLIFTDPVYDRVEDYQWLAEMAASKLTENGALLAWCTIKSQYDLVPMMRDFLAYNWTFSATVHGSAKRLIHYHVFTKTTPLLWFGARKPEPWIMDTVSAVTGHDEFSNSPQIHGWQTNPQFVAYYLQPFTKSPDVVLDPFCGGGTVPVVCKMLSRHYLAFEIDPDVAERARERVRNTQPPLFVMEPEQLEFG